MLLSQLIRQARDDGAASGGVAVRVGDARTTQSKRVTGRVRVCVERDGERERDGSDNGEQGMTSHDSRCLDCGWRGVVIIGPAMER